MVNRMYGADEYEIKHALDYMDYHYPNWKRDVKKPAGSLRNPCPSCGSTRMYDHPIENGMHCPFCGNVNCPRDCW